MQMKARDYAVHPGLGHLVLWNLTFCTNCNSLEGRQMQQILKRGLSRHDETHC